MKTVLIAGLLLAALGTPVHAHDTGTENKGPYVGLGVTTVKHGWADERATRAKFFAGYNFNDSWGIELGARQRSDFDISFGDTSSSGFVHSTSSGRTMYLAGKFTAPLMDRLSLQTKLGVSHNTGRIYFVTSGVPGPFVGSDSSNGLYASLGLKYQLATRVAMTLEMERNGKATYAREERETVSLNASFGF